MEKLTLDTIGGFTWDFGQKFHIETDVGNFEWSDPDYGGDNSIKPTVPYKDWLRKSHIPFGRCKGEHRIRDYCGEDVRLPFDSD